MSKRNARRWRFIDLVSAGFFIAFLVFFVVFFKPAGEALTEGQAAAFPPPADPQRREKLLALADGGKRPPIDACPAGAVDYMPCEDPKRNSQLSREMNFYRERHCPAPEESPVCLIPPPVGYKIPVQWPESLHKVHGIGSDLVHESCSGSVFPPQCGAPPRTGTWRDRKISLGPSSLQKISPIPKSYHLHPGPTSLKVHKIHLDGCVVDPTVQFIRMGANPRGHVKFKEQGRCGPVGWTNHQIWHSNMPHNKIAERKGHQGWMKKEGSYFIFPGGGTMFPDGATEYIEKLGKYIPISGGILRTALDMGCGVASFGGFLLKEDILTLSFAPRDSHKAQIQFVLERGIPAFVAMLGTHQLPFPAFSFDLVHCSRCLIPFTAYNGTYFIEVDRLLRPGGYLVISGPPVQWPKQDEDWADLQVVARSLCYELIVVDEHTVIWKKPSGDSCLLNQNEAGFELCNAHENPSEGWYFTLKKCISKLPSVNGDIAVGFIPNWPDRLKDPPARVTVIKNGMDVFDADTWLWARRVAYYKKLLKIKLGTSIIRNVMDMNAFFGGFAAALSSDPVWVMNVVPAHGPSTLDVIYDRGLIGVYHDWCEAFSTYPRTYDFIHAVGIESLIRDHNSSKSRCHLLDLMIEMDRMLRPSGTVVLRDSSEVLHKVGLIARAIRWRVTVYDTEPESNEKEKVLVATKRFWKSYSASH